MCMISVQALKYTNARTITTPAQKIYLDTQICYDVSFDRNPSGANATNADARPAGPLHLTRHPPVQLLLVEARRGNGLQRRGHERDEPGGLHHVHVLRPCPIRQRPPEVLHHVPDHGRHEVDPELRARAHPPAGAEREHAEVGSLDVDVLLEEALRPELQRVVPDLGIARHRPDVDDDVGALGDVVAGELDAGAGLVWEHQRRRRGQPERLLDDGLQVGQVLEVRLQQDPVPADDAVQLLLQLLLHPGVPHQLRHRPLHRYHRRVRASGDHVPEETDDGVVAEVVLVPEGEECVDEVLLGAALLAGLGVLLHDLHGEAVAPIAVGFEELLVERGQPPQPRDVLRDGEGRADLDPVVDDRLELKPLSVQLACRVHEPLPEGQPRDVVEGHHRQVVSHHNWLPFLACMEVRKLITL
uniref:Uncharacterized protein n=1 Tax=Arundo donax TaxID=35708 RepID=A0A0A9CID3_ARUDO